MTTSLAPAPAYRLDPYVDAPLVGPRVLHLVGDESGCAMWRAWNPVALLRLSGYPADWARVSTARLADVDFRGYDAVVLHRLAWTAVHQSGAWRWMQRQRRAGLRVWFECDDDLFTPFTVDQQLHRVDAEKARAQLEADAESCRWMLRAVDGVTVTTQYLASTVRRFTDAPVEVVPNAIDATWFEGAQRGLPRPVPGLTIGWAGGNRPDSDLAQMALAWGRIAQRFPAVTFVVAGHQPPVIGQVVPAARLHRVPWLPAHQYPAGMVGVDIGCCPLDDRPFNRAKTPIKAFEWALSGAAVVASPTVYGRVLDEPRTGLVASTADDWETALAALLSKRDRRRSVAAALKREVLVKWALRPNVWRWPHAWSRLMEAPPCAR